MLKKFGLYKRFLAFILVFALIFSLIIKLNDSTLYAVDGDNRNSDLNSTISYAMNNEAVNLALGKRVIANNTETGTAFTADKITDGVYNPDVSDKTQQSRWGTNELKNNENVWVQIDLGEEKSFQSLVLIWERPNIMNYKLQISSTSNNVDNTAWPADSDWHDIFVKNDNREISDNVEIIRLADKVQGRYLRLLITSYTGKHVVGNPKATWRSVSMYELAVYEDKIPSKILPINNFSLTASATANDYETSTNFTPDKVKDGDTTQNSRWGTNKSDSIEPRQLTLEFSKIEYLKLIKILWERQNNNIINYNIEVSLNGTDFVKVYERNKRVENKEDLIFLDTPVFAKFIRLNVTKYDGGNINWPNVGIIEFETYAKMPPPKAAVIEQNTSLASLAENFNIAPALNEDNTAFLLPKVPEFIKLELLADYEQIVNKDGTINQPLNDQKVTLIYKISKDGKSKEGKHEFVFTIKGKNSSVNKNPKPQLIPEIQQWEGGEGNYQFKDGATIFVADNEPSLFVAKELQNDIKSHLNLNLSISKVSTLNESSLSSLNLNQGDIVLLLDKDVNINNIKDKEAYSLTITDTLLIKATDAVGAFWGSRTVLQLLDLSGQSLSIPKGNIIDYPLYPVRSFSIDVARKPISLETMYYILREMSYYKMNDLQIHLNDNAFLKNYSDSENPKKNVYSAFRLESNVKKGQVFAQDSKNIPNAADLTSSDLYYSKKDFRKFIEYARKTGVNIVPEIDAPGHSNAFIKVRPDLSLTKEHITEKSKIGEAGEQFDLSPSVYNDSFNVVSKVWDEFLTPDMFDPSMVVHVGTDEYYGNNEAFRKFSDDIIAHIQKTNPKVRVWGSLSRKRGKTPVRHENVQLNLWSKSYAEAKEMYNLGYDLINTNEFELYIVPNANYYSNYLNTKNLFNNWQINSIAGVHIPSPSKQMLGSTFAIWNDNIDKFANGISEDDIIDRFIHALPTLAAKNWGINKLTYGQLQKMQTRLKSVNNDLFYKGYINYSDDPKSNYLYAKYSFNESAKDEAISPLMPKLKVLNNVQIENNALKLNSGVSYAEGLIKKLPRKARLEFDITLLTEAIPGQILFEADHEGSEAYSHDIRITSDGNLGFTRELYEYSFNYKLPVNQKKHVIINSDGTSTVLIVDGTEYKAVGKFVDPYNGIVKNSNIRNGQYITSSNKGRSVASLNIPVQRIGSKTNAVSALIDNVAIYARTTKDAYLVDGSNFTATSDNEQKGNEAAFAFDNKPNTIWHSAWNPYKALPASIEVDMHTVNTINKMLYYPRNDKSVNGNITEYSLYYKLNENDEWTSIAEHQFWDSDNSVKTAKFAEIKARYFKIVAHNGASDAGRPFASASKFEFLNEAQQTAAVNKTELESILQTLSDIRTSDKYIFADNSLKENFEKAVNLAEEIFTDDAALTEEVNNAIQKLKEAITNLNGVKPDPVPAPKPKPSIVVEFSNNRNNKDAEVYIPETTKINKIKISHVNGDIVSLRNTFHNQIPGDNILKNYNYTCFNIEPYIDNRPGELNTKIKIVIPLDNASQISKIYHKSIELQKSNVEIVNERLDDYLNQYYIDKDKVTIVVDSLSPFYFIYDKNTKGNTSENKEEKNISDNSDKENLDNSKFSKTLMVDKLKPLQLLFNAEKLLSKNSAVIKKDKVPATETSSVAGLFVGIIFALALVASLCKKEKRIRDK